MPPGANQPAMVLQAAFARDTLLRNCCCHRIAARTQALRLHTRAAVSVGPVQREHVGQPGTTDYRLFFKANGERISPWHDIPLRSSDLFHAVIEIPKFTKAKMEIATKEAHNPIAQDIKNGKLRDYPGPIYWNYGALPQTWEDVDVKHEELQLLGDNDPVDVVEIGSRPLETGSIVPVRVLGALALIDDGELDWKLLCINAEDPLANKLQDVSDVERECPGVVSGVREWFRWYKTPTGKAPNQFGFNGEAVGRSEALQVIEETHAAWRRLVDGKANKRNLWIPA